MSSYSSNRETESNDEVHAIRLPSMAVSDCSILPVHLWPRRSIHSMSSFTSGTMYRPPSAASYYMDVEEKISVELDSDSADWTSTDFPSAPASPEGSVCVGSDHGYGGVNQDHMTDEITSEQKYTPENAKETDIRCNPTPNA